MGNVVIVTHWLDGDVIPFIRIGQELIRRGHEVILITHCYFEAMARSAGLAFEAWDTPEEYAAMVEAMSGNKVGKTEENNYSFATNSFRQQYESIETRLKEYNKIMKYCTKPGTVILCKNRSSIAAYLAAERCRLPLATVMMNPTEVMSMLVYEQMEGDNDLPRLNELRSDVDLEAVDSWLQWESSAKMTLALWPEWYDETGEDWPAPIEAVGFPLETGKETGKQEIPEQFAHWMEEHPNPIVISGGTTKCIDDHFYSSSIAACGLSGQPTVVLTRYRELLPPTMPDNVIWYDYLPLDRILPEVKLLVHHGGMGTLSGALMAGVPQLILPCYVDRPYNANLIKKLGVGDYLYLANWQPEKIKDMIVRLQAPEIRTSCIEYAKKMQLNCGITLAADRVEHLMTDTKYVYSINRQYKNKVKPNGIYVGKEKRQKETLPKLTQEQRQRLLKRVRNKG